MKYSIYDLLLKCLLFLALSSIILSILGFTSCNKVDSSLSQTVNLQSNTPIQNNSQINDEANIAVIQIIKTPLQEAVCNSSILADSANAKKLIIESKKLVDKLLSEGVDVNKADNHGQTPIFCITDQNLDIAEKLIAKGSNVNQSDENGQTPLINVVSNKNAKAVKLLIKSGANVNAKDKDNWSVLQQALVSGCSTIVNDLEKAGAKLD